MAWFRPSLWSLLAFFPVAPSPVDKAGAVWLTQSWERVSRCQVLPKDLKGTLEVSRGCFDVAFQPEDGCYWQNFINISLDLLLRQPAYPKLMNFKRSMK